MQKSMKDKSEVVPTKINFNNTVWPHPFFASTLNDVFRKLDLAVNGQLSAHELNQFGKIIQEPLFMSISDDDFDTKDFDDINCNENGVSLLGFKQMLFRNFEDDEIMEILRKLGYDECLYSLKSRAFMMSFQATDEITVGVEDICDSDFYKTAWEYLLNHLKDTHGMNSQCTQRRDCNIFSYSHRKAYACSYLAENKTNSHLLIKLDLRRSESALFIPSDGTIEKVVGPGESAYIGSSALDPDARSWSYGYNVDTQVVEGSDSEESD